jgi:hypothetical protein
VTRRSAQPPRRLFSARRLAALVALATLSLTGCVPGVSTPTPAAPAGRPPPVSDKVIQQAPNIPSPPSGPIPGASPANPGAAGGYPVPGPATTPVTRPAPGAAYP